MLLFEKGFVKSCVGVGALVLLLGFLLALDCRAEPEINGLIVNQTRTRTGQEFYRHFCTLWGEPRTAFRYNILIREIPDARWGSLIIVEVNGRMAYRKTVRPRSNNAEEAAQESIPMVRGYLRYLIQTNGDQQTDDLLGDGY